MLLHRLTQSVAAHTHETGGLCVVYGLQGPQCKASINKGVSSNLFAANL